MVRNQLFRFQFANNVLKLGVPYGCFFLHAFSDDNNWNPIEWDRAAEELTWERVCRIFFLSLCECQTGIEKNTCKPKIITSDQAKFTVKD